MNLLFLLIAFPTDADRAVLRHEQWSKTLKSVSVDLKFRNRFSPVEGTGSLLLDLPNRMLFRVKWSPEDYTYSVIDGSAVEVEHSRRLFDEQDGLPRAVIIDSNVSSLLQFAFPSEVNLPSLRRVTPPGTAFKFVGKVTVEGVEADEVTAEWTQPEPAKITAAIDKDGRLMRYRLEAQTMNGPVDRQTTFFNWRVNQALPREAFAIKVPRGYEPIGTPRPPYPPELELPIKLGSWKQAGNGRSVNLDAIDRGKPKLVVLLDADDTASVALTAHLAKLREVARKAGANLYVCSTGDAAGAARFGASTLVAANGEALALLRAPGTPWLVAVDGKGVLQQSWLGFDAAGLPAMLEEIEKRLKGLPNE